MASHISLLRVNAEATVEEGYEIGLRAYASLHVALQFTFQQFKSTLNK